MGVGHDPADPVVSVFVVQLPRDGTAPTAQVNETEVE